jgi:hypothetical protein
MITPGTSVPSENTRLTEVPGTAPIGSGTGTAQLLRGTEDDADSNEATRGSPAMISTEAVAFSSGGSSSDPAGI